jgi:hypothetical protein
MTAIAIQRKPEILKRMANGDRLVDIASDLGVTRSAISNQLLDEPEYRAARESGALARIEKWEQHIEGMNCKEEAAQVSLARAREMLAHARWRAEREFPGRWGQKNETTVDARLTIEIVKFGAQQVVSSGAVIEHNQSTAEQVLTDQLVSE